MIVKEYHPFRLADEAKLKKLLNMLCPGYKLPSRKTLSSSLISKLYNTTKEKNLQKIKTAPAICITIDGWTSINN